MKWGSKEGAQFPDGRLVGDPGAGLVVRTSRGGPRGFWKVLGPVVRVPGGEAARMAEAECRMDEAVTVV